MRRLALAALLAAACASVSFAYEIYALGDLSRDSDGLSAWKYSAGFRVPAGKIKLGACAGRGNLSAATSTRFFYTYALTADMEFSPSWQVYLQGGWEDFRKSYPAGSASAVYSRGSGFRAETYFERSLVETPASFDNGVSMTSIGTAFDIPLARPLILVAGGDLRLFSDDNIRRGLTVKAICLLPWEGLSLQAWHRGYENSAGPRAAYFNPDSVGQQRLILALRAAVFGRFRLTLKAGPGLQSIDHAAATGSWYGEGALEGRIAGPLSLAVRLIHADDAAVSVTPGYRISMFSTQLTGRF